MTLENFPPSKFFNNRILNPSYTTIFGWRNISSALNIFKTYSKNPNSQKRIFFRITKKYGFPVHSVYSDKRGRIFMIKKDIDIINEDYLFGIKSIAKYLGIHTTTLWKWFERFPKIPIERPEKRKNMDKSTRLRTKLNREDKRKEYLSKIERAKRRRDLVMAYKPELILWYATLLFSRIKGEKFQFAKYIIKRFDRNPRISKSKPVMNDLLRVINSLYCMGLSCPKELKKYWIYPNFKILKITQ